jgi:hypothetical protein
MPIVVETKDCTALSDVELAEMADLCAQSSFHHEVGTLSKQAEDWVLVTQARDDDALKGFTFSTLERIGGTPCVLVGLAAVKQNSRRETVLRQLMAEELRRAVLAFPDEDVLVATRMTDPSAFEAFKPLSSIVPRSGHNASGEERAWGRRLAKRYGVVPSRYADRAFHMKGDGTPPLVLDYVAAKPEKAQDWAEFFEVLDTDNGDCLVGFGWAVAEELAKYA